MLSQFIGSLLSSITNSIVSAFHSWSRVRFYFLTILIFLFAIGFLYKDLVATTVQTMVFNEIKFRECRDIVGLTGYMTSTSKKDTIIEAYTIYLYQPVNNSIYKRLVISNDPVVMKSPMLQGIYLNTQPTVNTELIEHDYYLANYDEFMRHPDTQFWSDFSKHTRLAYALKLNGKVIGEIWIRFKADPTPIQLENTLKDISPILYNYIL
jgi:hypothetical protein